jgi:cytidine deaminase
MTHIGITKEDQELIDAATTVIQKNYLRGKHHVGAAIRTRSGKIYSGVHMESKNVDVCAEQVAMGIAISNGEKEFDSIVSIQMRDVSEPTVIAPCQTCKELINFYGPEMSVIIATGGDVQKYKARDLLNENYSQ